MKAVKVAVIGAAGYAGEELLRLLRRHPHARITQITSRTYAGQPVGNVFPRFVDTGLEFVAPVADEVAASADVVFLALPHGLAAEYAVPLLAHDVKVIDISADFRLRDAAVYRAYYGAEHPAPQLLSQAVYGAPERYRERLRRATLIACPGCYPTSIALAVCPLLAAGLVDAEGIVINSLSGVSGAGRKIDLPYLFAECNESVRPYGVTGHRHLPEIEQELAAAGGLDSISVNFIPHLVPVTRGIHSTIVLRAAAGADAEAIRTAWHDAYADEPFVRLLPAGGLADTKHVVHSNCCELGFAFDTHTERVILSSAIDNLTKGASGQAVQCMNLVCGFPETAGLL